MSVHQADESLNRQAKAKVDELVADINRMSQDAASNGLIDKEKYVIPPHLHDLQEADLPETQRGLVISEIAQFRERAAKREREKLRDVRESIPAIVGAPSGPKVREWGKPQQASQPQTQNSGQQAFGKSAQGYSKPVGFVKAEDNGASTGALGNDRHIAGKGAKSDEEQEAVRKEGRRRDEEVSFRDVRTPEPSEWYAADVLLVSASAGTSQENGPGSRHWSEQLHGSVL